MKTLNEFAHGASAAATGDQSVLVVDDETAVRRFAARVLERDGFRVLQASDGIEALDLLQTRAQLIDAVVSDIVMPRMNGVELMRSLAVTHPYLPVILMSGYAPAELTALGIPVPCSMIPKPFSAERLLTEVRRCAKRRDGGSSAA
jgi:two-component system cell cycle sensor histidine kinase/response regulator CckA